MKLYYHKTDGGAEYLTDCFVVCPNGTKEGVFTNAKYIVRIDGDITKDAELSVASEVSAAPELLEALENMTEFMVEVHENEIENDHHGDNAKDCSYCKSISNANKAIAKAKGEL
jgi:hypothetical protein